jgi:hypothetical protein
MTGSGYLRLTGKQRTWTGFSQAWLGSDHLLVVNSIRLVERYQRFALSDIQALVVSEGGKRAVWQALVMVFCLYPALRVQSTFGRGFFAAVGSVALVLAIVDVGRGPKCRCVLQTAVSRERLFPVSRMRTARAFLATLAPAIESVQGSVSVAGEHEMDQLAPPPEPMTPVPAAPSEPIPQPPAIRRPLGYTPEILFGLLMLDSVLVFVGLRSTVAVALGLLPTVYFAEFLIGILAVVQAGTRNAISVTVLIAALLCVLIDPFILSGTAAWSSLVTMLRQATAGPPQFNIPVGAPMTTIALAAGWRAAMSVTGLAVCYFERTAAAA